jgi:hypothetical protein
MYDCGIVANYTFTNRSLSVTFFEDYVPEEREQIIPIRLPVEPMKASKKQLDQEYWAGKMFGAGCAVYKEQMRQPFMYKHKQKG